jgi:hypothetical protein
MRPDTVPTASEIAERTRQIMGAHWRSPGYTAPNPSVYPAQFLWDSCFHTIVWAELGEPDRALTELGNVFAHQADDGFVPHMTYWHDPDAHAEFWGRRHTSALTQPPMYGHAVAELARRGVDVGADLIDRAEAGLRFLVEQRRRDALVVVVHPWETGCDDSPRWDSWCPGAWSATRWKQVKGELVASLVFDSASRSSIGNPLFEVASAGFNALVGFNIGELASVAGRPIDPALARFVAGLSSTIADVAVPDRPSSHVRTSEALLGVLLDGLLGDDGFAQLRDPSAFGGAYGPTTVHRSEPAFDPTGYWRGPAWPQLTYLFWVAARRRGRPEAIWLGQQLVRGAQRSGFAEYWNPDSGAGLGARPQSWTGLAAVVISE